MEVDGNDTVTATDIYHITFDWPTNPDVVSRLEEVEGTSEEEVVARMVQHYRFIEDISRCYSHIQKTINADQPKADVFAQGRNSLSTTCSVQGKAGCKDIFKVLK